MKYIAVRWPVDLRQALKVAAASADPPRTMTEYLQTCFEIVQDRGGADACQKKKKRSKV